MIYRFAAFEFDAAARELRGADGRIRLEPQVFALLLLLIENRDRLVTRDEIVQAVWKGRIVSETAVSSRVKSARRAIGDDGKAQRLIRTVSKAGFRFVAEVATAAPPASPRTELVATAEPAEPAARPSIAVLPFEAMGGPGAVGLADALPHDIIAELSRLRWLFVIARASSFRFRGAEAQIPRVRAALNVRYCLSGVVDVDAGVMTVAVELCETDSGGVVWSERFRSSVGAVHEIRERIVQAVTGALELQIPLNEASRARLKAPGSLDAWSAYHLGLRHMYQFSRGGNALAASLFAQAIGQDPGFARAHAGLSFIHFENAFLGFAGDPREAGALSRRFAEQSLEHDPLDPFCNLVMGRFFWLGGDLEASLPWVDRALQLNPNYALAKYSRAWTETLMGRGADGQANVDAALELSPLDPLVYGMLGVRALSHLMLGEPVQAAAWGERAARAPGAHALIEVIAAVCHQLNGAEALARAWAHSARQRRPSLTSSEFFRSFPFREPAARRQVLAALTSLGL
ncbi:MAG: transcriptional regulator domain protein [Phenylobacterium sp.]|nr:transcriptional regulator domain protein [Phenylobacterium sp.]